MRLVDKDKNTVKHLGVSKWIGAFEGDLTDNPILKKGFPRFNDERFSIEIRDPAANKSDTVLDTITVDLLTFRPRTKTRTKLVDSIKGITLRETAVKSGVFRPVGIGRLLVGGVFFIIVTNVVDDEDSPGKPDGGGQDRTIRARVYDQIQLRYKNRVLSVPVCNSAQRERILIRVRYTVLRVVEPFRDEGIGTGAELRRTRGDGIWNWNDRNRNGRIDPGEAEHFRDANGNGRRDVSAAHLASKAQVLSDVELLNDSWAQACIEFRNTRLQKSFKNHGIVFKDPPPAEPFRDVGATGQPAHWAGDLEFSFLDVNDNGVHDPTEPSEPMTDQNGNNSYDFSVDLTDSAGGGLFISDTSKKPSRDEKSLISWLADDDRSTIDIFIVNKIFFISKVDGRVKTFNGWALTQRRAPQGMRNVFYVRAGTVGRLASGRWRASATSAHEAGHILFNTTSNDHVPELINLMHRGGEAGSRFEGIETDKRLTAAQATRARTETSMRHMRTVR